MKLKAGQKSRSINVNNKSNLKITSLEGCVNVMVYKTGSSIMDSCGATGLTVHVKVKGFNNFHFESKYGANFNYRLT